MNSLILVSLILSVLLGIFRGIDLTFWTDAETGLCVVGPVWLRYAALAAVVGIAVAAGRSSQPKPDALPGAVHPLRRRGTGRQRSAMERPLCCASSGCTAAW